MGVTGQAHFGRPGIIFVEGTEADAEDFAKQVRRGGRTVKLKKSQAMHERAANRQWQKMQSVGGGAGGALDLEVLQQQLEALGLMHKYRFIMGLESDLATA